MNLPMVRGIIDIPDLNTGPHAIEFVLDTGASASSLHPRDAAVVLGIDPLLLLNPPADWPAPEAALGTSGTSDYYAFACTYYFRHEDTKQWQTIRDIIRIARLTADNGSVPSLLGWNILRLFTVEVNHTAGDVFLR